MSDTAAHLQFLVAGQTDGWIEIAHGWRDPTAGLRMASRSDPANYFPVTDHHAAACRAADLAKRGEVLVGVLPRAAAGVTGKKGVRHVGRVAWLDIDDAAAAFHAARFGPAPHLTIASGGGGVHLYWLLDRVLPVEALERINRRLALHLGGDPAACDRGTVATRRRHPTQNSGCVRPTGRRPRQPCRQPRPPVGVGAAPRRRHPAGAATAGHPEGRASDG